MNKIEFIQQHLIEKGVPADLTKFNSNFLSKFIFLEDRPLVFQSLVTLFFRESLILSVIWGALMWLMVWHPTPENWIRYTLSSLAFGCIMGSTLVFRIIRAKKKLGNVSWETWCHKNYDSVS